MKPPPHSSGNQHLHNNIYCTVLYSIRTQLNSLTVFFINIPHFLLFEFSKLSTSDAPLECSRLYKAPCELYNFVEEYLFIKKTITVQYICCHPASAVGLLCVGVLFVHVVYSFYFVARHLAKMSLKQS